MRSKLALVCDPFYSFDRDICFQESYRYRVISAPLAALGPEIPVDVFSSETGQWSKLGIYCPEGLQGCLHTGVSPVMYNGMLHFLHTSHIFAFDPFVSEKDSVVACRVIGFPVANVDLPRFSFLETCSEFLRLSTGQWIDRSKCMSVWDLEDYDQGEWCLKFQFSLEDLKVSCAAYLYSKFDYMDDIDILRLLGFYPYDRDILYLLVPGFVVVYNMRTRISEAACEINLRTQFIVNRIMGHANGEIHRIFLPWWPTPVPAFTEQIVSAITDRCLAYSIKSR